MTFQTDLIKAARTELARFKGRKDYTYKDDPEVEELLRKYWMAGVNYKKEPAMKEIAALTAWSAAFISYLVRTTLASSGSKAPFAFSASHSVYAGAAILNDFNAVQPPAFFGYPTTGAGAERVQVGDIFGWSRQLSVPGYESALKAANAKDTYYSHFDVAVDVSDGTVTAIGGNVSDSVTERKVKLEDGYLPVRPFKKDSAGQIISGPYICIVRHVGS